MQYSSRRIRRKPGGLDGGFLQLSEVDYHTRVCARGVSVEGGR